MDDVKPDPVAENAGPADVRSDAARPFGRVARLPFWLHPLALIGLALLGVWVYWWIVSFIDMKLVAGRRSWVPAWSFLGLDFLHHYYAVPYWLKGGSVYLEQFGDPIRRKYAYPPIMLPLFVWVLLMGPKAATIGWTIASAGVFAFAARASGRVRRNLRLFDLTQPLVIAAVLLSMPVMFHLERGNSDVIVLLMLLLTVALLRRSATWPTDIAIAACLAIATWTKLYPVILLPGMLVLRRPRPFVLGGLFCAAIWLALWDPTLDWIERSRTIAREYPMLGNVYSHSVSGSWKYIWWEYEMPWLRKIPGLIGASFILLPLTLWASWHVYRCPVQKKLVYPYLLWLCAAGTFWFPVSMDYKLFFLPLVVMAVWDMKDRLLVHAFVGVMLLWWQPVHLPIPPWPLLLFKVLGLVGITISLVTRAHELSNALVDAALPAPPETVQPAPASP